MDIDVARTASALMPYATAVVAAYGKETVNKIRDLAVANASDATVSLGQRLLARILRLERSRASIEDALNDVADKQEDSESALRLQVRKALASDPDLARDIATILSQARNEASGVGSISIGLNSGFASTGNEAFKVDTQHNHGDGIFIGRDFKIGAGEG